jgi:hypothetical protein
MEIRDNVQRLEFTLRNNADWKQPIQLIRYDEATNTTSRYDLSSATLRMQWKAVISSNDDDDDDDDDDDAAVLSTTVALEMNTTNNRIVITDPPNGVFTTAVAAADLWQVAAGNYRADLLVLNADGSVDTAFTADIELWQGDTQPAVPTPVNLVALGISVPTPGAGSP